MYSFDKDLWHVRARAPSDAQEDKLEENRNYIFNYYYYVFFKADTIII